MPHSPVQILLHVLKQQHQHIGVISPFPKRDILSGEGEWEGERGVSEMIEGGGWVIEGDGGVIEGVSEVVEGVKEGEREDRKEVEFLEGKVKRG